MLIGLTGNFGTGKSTVLRMFEKRGAVVIDADAVVGSLYRDPAVVHAVASLLGDVRDGAGGIDRKKVAAIVFRDPVRRRDLENLLHGKVLSEIEGTANRHPGRLVIAEIPLLFETAYENNVAAVILTVCAPRELHRRLTQRGFSESEINDRLSAQLPQEQTIGRADFVIDTGKSMEETERAVERIHRKLIEKSRGD